MDIGSATIQGCRMDEISSSYPILNRLTAQSVNVDELDYRAEKVDAVVEALLRNISNAGWTRYRKPWMNWLSRLRHSIWDTGGV